MKLGSKLLVLLLAAGCSGEIVDKRSGGDKGGKSLELSAPAEPSLADQDSSADPSTCQDGLMLTDVGTTSVCVSLEETCSLCNVAGVCTAEGEGGAAPEGAFESPSMPAAGMSLIGPGRNIAKLLDWLACLKRAKNGGKPLYDPKVLQAIDEILKRADPRIAGSIDEICQIVAKGASHANFGDALKKLREFVMLMNKEIKLVASKLTSLWKQIQEVGAALKAADAAGDTVKARELALQLDGLMKQYAHLEQTLSVLRRSVKDKAAELENWFNNCAWDPTLLAPYIDELRKIEGSLL